MKNKNTGRPWLASWAVDCRVPSINVNSKCGMVLPTSMPTLGWFTMIAAFAGAAAEGEFGAGIGGAGGVDSGGVARAGADELAGAGEFASF